MPKRKGPGSGSKDSGTGEAQAHKQGPVTWVTDTSYEEARQQKQKLKLTVGRIRAKLAIKDPLEEDADLVAMVERRLPISAVSALIQQGVLEKEIYAVVIPRRTLQHRRVRKEKLSREESDRAVRLARLVTLAEDVFGAGDTADSEAWDEGMRWLRAPKKRFRGRTPMEMIATETGSRLVEETLYQIDEGMAA